MCEKLKFIGKAYVRPAEAASNPDAYLCLDSETQKGLVIRMGQKRNLTDLQMFADELNEWAGKGD